MHPGPPSFSSTSSSIFLLSLFFPLPKHFDCHLTPPRLIFLERRKPPFSLLLIWPQPKPTAVFPTRARCAPLDRSQPVRGATSPWGTLTSLGQCRRAEVAARAGCCALWGKHFSHNNCVSISDGTSSSVTLK